MKLYMSWNGATEVSKWLLEGFENNNNNNEEEEEENETTERRNRPSRTNLRNNPAEKISLVAKEGFETISRISSKAISHKTRFVRVVALDRDDKVLGTSDLMDLRGMDRDDEEKGVSNNSQQGEEKGEKEKNFPFKLTNTDILLISFVGLLVSLSFKFIFGFTAMGGRGRGKGRRGGSKETQSQEQERQQQDKKKKKQKSKYKYSLLLQ